MQRVTVIFTISLLIFITLFACSSDDHDLDNHEELNLTIETSSYNFVVGDALGLFVDDGTTNNENLKWIYQESGRWKPASDKDKLYTTNADVILSMRAYFPYSDEVEDGEIKINSPSCIMSGKTSNVRGESVSIMLEEKTTKVKIIIPDLDALSLAEVSLLDVYIGGRMDIAKLGENDDFEKSKSTSNHDFELQEDGSCVFFLPKQSIENNHHLLNIKIGEKELEYRLPSTLELEKDKDNIIIVSPLFDNVADLPNTYMVKPGNDLFISVQKVYHMWEEDSLLSSLNVDFSGSQEATLVWQEDLNEVIKSIELIGEGRGALLHIKTKDGNIGNAVVALKIGENIRWSWQIWVTDYNPAKQENGTTYQYNGFTFMDRNLGATINPSIGGEKTFGLYYQWGRKDPFKTRGKVETLPVASDVKNNLANSIMHPDIYITSSVGQNDWYIDSGIEGLDRWNSSENTKTAFDPCPRGWRVPSGTNEEPAWKDLNLPDDENSWGNGWYFKDNPKLGYYPAAGQRTVTGVTTYTGSAGFYHTAQPNATMRMDYTSLNLKFGGGRATGRSVRCIQEY